MRRLQQFKQITAALTLSIVAFAAFPVHAATNAGTTGNSTGNVTDFGVYPAATPSLSPNTKSPLQLDQQGNLKVNIVVGGSSASAQPVSPAVGTSPFPVTAATTIPVTITGSSGTGTGSLGSVVIGAGANNIGTVTVQGNAGAVPVPVAVSTAVPLPVVAATALPVTIVGGSSGGGSVPFYYASPLPTLSPGASTQGVVDSNGLQILSPQSNIETGGGIYEANPIPIQSGQVTQVATDEFKNTKVVFPAPQPISIETTGSIYDRSASVINATTSQVIMVANPSRHGFFIQNNSTHTLCINELDNNASCGFQDIQLAPNSLYETPNTYAPKGAISIYGPSAGDAFVAREW